MNKHIVEITSELTLNTELFCVATIRKFDKTSTADNSFEGYTHTFSDNVKALHIKSVRKANHSLTVCPQTLVYR